MDGGPGVPDRRPRFAESAWVRDFATELGGLHRLTGHEEAPVINCNVAVPPCPVRRVPNGTGRGAPQTSARCGSAVEASLGRTGGPVIESGAGLVARHESELFISF